jgi:hypothetical protein
MMSASVIDRIFKFTWLIPLAFAILAGTIPTWIPNPQPITINPLRVFVKSGDVAGLLRAVDTIPVGGTIYLEQGVYDLGTTPLHSNHPNVAFQGYVSLERKTR